MSRIPSTFYARVFSCGLLVNVLFIGQHELLAQSVPIHQWHFQQQQIKESHVAPDHGAIDAMVVGSVRFHSKTPHAFVFDGKQKPRQFVQIANDLATTKLPLKSITVEAWVLVDKVSDWGGICGVIQDNGDFERGWLLGFKKSQFIFGLTAAGRKRLTYLTDSKSFEPGNWYHVVGTYDGKYQRLYVDGKQRAQSTHQHGHIAYPPKGQWAIGCYIDDNEFYPLTGQVERVSIFDTSLSADEISKRFDARSARFPGIHATAPKVAGWPTYMRDTQRTGISDERLQLPLELQWVYKAQHPPEPAWPPPAKTDYWNRKYNLKPRVVFDRALHTVAVNGRVYFASSADDKVYCLDALTGKELWSFFAEAPIRLAPTVAGQKLLFGADDGCAYCLDAETGALQWKFNAVDGDERFIPGNGRVISTQAIRTSVLVEGNVGFFCAGLFPNQGVYQLAVDINTGKEIDRAQVNVAAQGYLERRSGQLYVPAGRNPAGVFASELQRRGKGVGKEVSQLSKEFPFAFIGSSRLRFGGGDGKVAAFDKQDGSEKWSTAVEGRAYSLAIAEGRLLVSTDQGRIYCYGKKSQRTNASTSPVRARPDDVDKPVDTFTASQDGQFADSVAAASEKIIESSGISKGYCLVLSGSNIELVKQLSKRTELKTILVEQDSKNADKARSKLDAVELYGQAVVHHRVDFESLPYTDYMFNLIIVSSAIEANLKGKLEAELKRMLTPGNGALCNSTGTLLFKRSPLTKTGEWSHMYGNPANTSCSTDQRVQGRMALQWFGEPGPREMVNRHHRTVAPLWKSGRLIIPGDDQIFAADAYNGTLLWHVKIPNSRRIAAFRDCSYLVAGTASVFVAVDNTCLILDAASGKTQRVLAVPELESKLKYDWGYLANVGDLVVGSVVKKGAIRREHTRESISDTYYDHRATVCSDALFAMRHVETLLPVKPDSQAVDEAGAAALWTYHPSRGAIINSTISIADGRIVFVESNDRKTLEKANGRNELATLMKAGAEMVALSLTTGKVEWRVPAEFTRIEHNIYTCISQSKVIVVGSRNSGQSKSDRVLYDIHVFDAKTGKPIWQATQDQKVKIGGSHGEQDLHPVVVKNRVYCEPYAYDLATGKVLSDWGWRLGKRSGCGAISASESAFFFRHRNPTMFDLTTKKLSPVTTSTRPGCFINIIPAGGLLLIPEASSGCTCNYAVQTSLAFLPIAE